ncbi:MAG: carbohydrate kinase [Duncaniella sp.]|nr:carbohydrate kinase [Duncaniella sp.]
MDGIIVGIGEALWDLLPQGMKLGGAPANFAYHVSQFGLRSCVISAVGDDSLGREILDTFAAKAFDSQVQIVPYPTGTVQVEVDADGVPRYDIKEEVAWDNIQFLDEFKEYAAQTIAVCFGSLAQRSEVSRRTIKQFIESMPQGQNRLVVFDVNLRQNFYTKEIIHQSLKLCNILKINDEELETVSLMLGLNGMSPEEQCRELVSKYNLKILILTCGVNGSYVYTAEMKSFQPTPQVVVADTVGAGDSFTAAFISSIIKGKSIAEAHSMAVKTSAYVCSQKGAMPILPAELTAN